MKSSSWALMTVLCLSTAPAWAAQQITHFQDWAVASDLQNGRQICYSFTQSLTATHPTKECGAAVIVVTHTPPHRDRVVISPCRPYGAGQATLALTVDKTTLPFQSKGKFAYAQQGPEVVTAFRRGMKATVPGPTGGGTETFSLRGFAAAYDSMQKDCEG